MLYVLLVLLALEWVLISQPIVEVGSSLLGMVKSFTIFEMHGESSVQAIIIILHVVSLFVLLVLAIKKQEGKGVYYIPALITSLTDAFLYIQVALKLDSLITDTMLGELIQFGSIDVSMTVTSTCLIIVAVAACVFAARMALQAVNSTHEGSSKDEPQKPAVKWKGPLFKKGDLREAAVVLIVLCLAVSAELTIPTMLRNLLHNSIVDSWYIEGAEKGDSPSITFYKDNTCDIDGLYGTNQWDIEDGKLLITTFYGERTECSYEWEGNNLIINGVKFTRYPSG